METYAALTVIFGCFLLYSLLARRIEASVLSGPMLFTALGFALSQAGVTVLTPGDRDTIELLATATLVIILFRDAANIRISSVMAERATALITLRLLFIGIPLTILAGTVAGMALFPELGLFGALILAIVLTPTDAALAQPVFANRSLAEVPREALDAESGLNDGLCLPLLLVALGFATEPAAEPGLSGHAAFFASQVVFGPLVGGLAGLAGAWAAAVALTRKWSNSAGRTPVMVVLAGLAYVAAELAGGNGFLAAFCAGLVFGWRLREDEVRQTSSFAMTEGSLLTNLTFLIFGAAILPEALDMPVVPTLLYAVLSLTLVRMLPVFLAMLGVAQPLRAKLFVGWFGPRGLASVLYLVLVVDRSGFEGAAAVTDVAVFAILLSVFLHGMTAPFAARLFFPGSGGTARSERRSAPK